MTTTAAERGYLESLRVAIANAVADHDQAKATADAARTAVAEASASLAAYEARVADGELPTTASTLATKRDALALAELALPGAERREREAMAVLRTATIALVIAQVTDDDRISRTAELAAREQAVEHLHQARKVLEEFYSNRNAALAEARAQLEAAEAPTASASTIGTPLTIHSEPESRVHRLDNLAGVLVDGREVVPENPRRHADTILGRELRKILPLAVRQDMV